MAGLEGKKLKQVIDPTLAKAFAHPLRGHIWVTLFEKGVLSPTEIATELDLEVSEVSYHFRKLHRKKLIRLVRTVQKRGFDEHFYEPVTPAIDFDDAEWMKLPRGIRAGMSAEMLRGVVDSFVAALEAGSFDARNRHLTRTWLLLDERGWGELAKLLLNTLERMKAIQERSTGRCKKSPEVLIPVEIAIAAFETATSISRRGAGGTEAL